jgi:uncharacterized phiE125 gp8 family phage protein
MTSSGYQLRRLFGPEVEPITVAEAKAHCRVDADLTAEDDLFAGWITAARELAEDYTKRTFCESVWELWLDDFPRFSDDLRVVLPMGAPFVAVESVSYLSTNGDRVELAGYEVLPDEPPAIRPSPWTVWPVVSCAAGAVRVRYRAGYVGEGSPAGAEAVPQRVKQALRMLVGHWYANRESVTAGGSTGAAPVEVPYSFERALDPLRVYP